MDKILYSFEGMITCQAAFGQKNYGLTSKKPINCKIIEEENSGLTSKKLLNSGLTSLKRIAD